ncbi:MAG: class I SAM-dependent methyltransferase [Phycisphaeraceae bacterium]|nr:class I SAM-dependent methyltransferase [Phycisphaeraceae bacterium]
MPQDFQQGINFEWWHTLLKLYERPHAWPGSIAPEAGLLLHALVRNIRPNVVIETGTCHGASTIWIASALATTSQGILHTFDRYELPSDSPLRQVPLFREQERQVRDRIAEANLTEHVVVHSEDSSSGIAKLASTISSVELAYLDGDHSFEGVWADFQAVDPLIPTGGYLMLHDVFPEHCGWRGPRELLQRLESLSKCKYASCDICTAPNNYGLSLLRKLSR